MLIQMRFPPNLFLRLQSSSFPQRPSLLKLKYKEKISFFFSFFCYIHKLKQREHKNCLCTKMGRKGRKVELVIILVHISQTLFHHSLQPVLTPGPILISLNLHSFHKCSLTPLLTLAQPYLTAPRTLLRENST